MSEFTLSSQQQVLARHALGLPNKYRKSYRNRYVVGCLSETYKLWGEMVTAGMAEEYPMEGSSIGQVMFCLTRPGAEAVLKRGERLCAEDFPPEVA